MLKLIYAPQDANFAEKLRQDLARRQPIDDLSRPGNTQAKGDVLLVVLSAEAWKDKSVQSAVYVALDNSQHVIPVFAGPAKLPRVLNHLEGVDMTNSANLQTLLNKIAFFQSPDAPRPMKVLTPTMRSSNMIVLSIFGVLATSMFCIGLVAIGGGVSRPPADEYNQNATVVQATVQFEIETGLAGYMAFLPDNAEEAANYSATLQTVPTRYRPFMAQTATDYAMRAQGTPTPTPTPTPEAADTAEATEAP
ncbi:MAG: toll/interleukin-1 receptor domain-containing protein [Pleurocapsa minor GSE-CHR-MK-17-07R]|jgi:hypothetical protein|nr:toll/interleukin-1 receptor domain-containing protein [Pleurocapsa minor GSE-CHR-MK 17-07R]